MMERDEDTFAASGKTVYRDCINWSNNDHCAKTKANYCHPDCGDYRQLVKLVKRPETLEEIEADLRNDNRRFSNSTGAVIAQRIEAARKRMEWMHKKELETRDAVIQTEVAGREAEREAHKREIDKLIKTNAELAKLIDPEKMPPVNAAKLREALRECAQYIACLAGIGAGEVTINDNVHLTPGELTQKAIAALDATEQEGGDDGR